MKKTILFLLFVLLALKTYSQNNVSQNVLLNGEKDSQIRYEDGESFSNLTDREIKVELAEFIKITNKINVRNTLINIPLEKCYDDYAYFEKGNLWASDLIIRIKSNKVGKNEFLKQVFYIHYKAGFALPDSAIIDIANPILCTEYSKKGKPIASCCKVFQSNDKRRVYIYLIFEQFGKKHEVTWIIQNNKYLRRVIDVIE